MVFAFAEARRSSRVVESSESIRHRRHTERSNLHRTAVLRSRIGISPAKQTGRQARQGSVRPRWHNFIPSIEEHPFVSSTASTRTRGELRSFARRNFLMGVFQLAGCAKPHQSGVFHGVSFRPVRWMEKPLLCGFLTWLYWVFFNSMRWSVGLLFRTFCVVVPCNSRKIPS